VAIQLLCKATSFKLSLSLLGTISTSQHHSIWSLKFFRGWGSSLVTVHVPRMPEALGSIHNSKKQNKTKQNKNPKQNKTKNQQEFSNLYPIFQYLYQHFPLEDIGHELHLC
jgi:hypothetical protein